MNALSANVRALKETSFSLPGQTGFYRGKVRDVYTIHGKYLVMVVTDRISAFDVVLPRAIPYKGQVLNQIAAFMMQATRDIVPNWIIDVPDPNVTIGRKCQAFKVEMVIRGFLTGHAWREYNEGKRILCGVKMPDGMRENDPFPEPLITPTTKAAAGHDQDISREEILKQGIVAEEHYVQMEKFTRKLYEKGRELASKRGLILVDTKYEFGNDSGKIMLIDEIHTPDSSRYFYADSYEKLQAEGKPQRQLSKEFVRQWLIENNFQGKEGQKIPSMSDEWIENISLRYIELYEKIIAERFIPSRQDDILVRIEDNIRRSLAAFT
jgi:phosphoribosylaminoimidazole-succinocarboxamide synthase